MNYDVLTNFGLILILEWKQEMDQKCNIVIYLHSYKLVSHNLFAPLDLSI